jgi:hypothetical protein
VGSDRSKWPTATHFASWLGLCPDNRSSGGTVLTTGSRRVQNRASRAWRMAAQSLRKSPSSLGAFHRRLRSTRGPAKATTATAHKLAKIIYHMLQEKTPYQDAKSKNVGLDNCANTPNIWASTWCLKHTMKIPEGRKSH